MSRPGPSGFLINALPLIQDVGVSLATLYYLRDYKALLMVPGLNYVVHVPCVQPEHGSRAKPP